eukprot:5291294-Amphidinium_carterae.2
MLHNASSNYTGQLTSKPRRTYKKHPTFQAACSHSCGPVFLIRTWPNSHQKLLDIVMSHFACELRGKTHKAID